MAHVLRTLILVVVAAKLAHAEIEPLSPQKLKSASTDIIIGKVEGRYTDESRDKQWHNTRGVIELRVTKVEKGDQLELGDVIYARYWKLGWIGEGPPEPHGSGHSDVPTKGKEVRVYLVRKDGRYDVMLPNGFEPLRSPKQQP